jgi:LmbE family N-acetylglucosaminyl deacetylase
MQLSRAAIVRGLTAVNRWLGSETWLARSLGARTLVFAPHPDDEVLGCGGTIVLKVRSGAAVQVVIMTDGRASHAHLIAPSELIRIREEEARGAALRLGLPTEAYRFLGFEDHALATHGKAASLKVREVLEGFRPDEIYVPHARDSLSDHVATNSIVRAALAGYSRPVTVFEYPVWLWNTWPWTRGGARSGAGPARRFASWLRDLAALVFGCRAGANIRSAVQVKLHALGAYASQIERRGGNSEWPILADVSAGEFLACFAAEREIFRRWQHRP